ncbi:unnamed protein product [Spirodela intermedia]|uniref:Uncharacterized protein n=1 Tax=Spirodela intermedia TaxID=51605 RepID=A0A7I8L977_SPIIN|nr:unnamed protein product [Spirodela intermedia]
MDYRQSNDGHILFFKHSRNKISILLVYVGDMILTRDDMLEIEMLNDKLFACFKIKRLENLKYFSCDNTLATTPIKLDGKLGRSEDNPPVDRGRYQRLIGKLIYLSHTRPNITYVVKLLSQFIHDPREVHNAVARRVLLYLKGILDYGLLFQPHGHTNVKIFIDADYVGSIVERRFTSRYCSFLRGNLII